MKYLAATTIPVKINALGVNYFPLTQKLIGRKILAINFVQVEPFEGKQIESVDGTFISITPNGTDYKIKDMPLGRLSTEICRGINIEINDVISVQDCYINCQYAQNIGCVATLLVWYELDGYSANDTYTTNKYDSFEVPILSNKWRNYFPDNRSLAGKSFTEIFTTRPIVTPNFKPLMNWNTIAQKGYISLLKGSFAVWDRMPVSVLLQLYDYEYLQFNNLVFDFESSFIELAQVSDDEFSPGYLQICVKYN